MDFNKLTIKSQEAVQEALNLVRRNGQQQVETAHLLLGVLKVGDSIVNFLFQKLGVNGRLIEQLAEKQMQSYPKVSGAEPYISRETEAVLNDAVDVAGKQGDEFVTLDSIIVSLVRVKSPVASILKDAGITEKELLSAAKELKQDRKADSQTAEETYQSLKKYAKNLIEEARSGKLDPVIGRDEEIRRVLQILSRRTKNNP
ncbi:MAG: type VI secretion system ATPase TssH, partial [Bacteroidaceae bacterium]|nr:type VI secretion system ATPase TssH [Bacteroidaceae bacterium]